MIEKLRESLRASDSAFSRVEDSRSLLDAADQSILAKAFRGELVPQDPNDEPASVLLDRIRSERAATNAIGKLGRKSTRNPRPKTTAHKRGPSRKNPTA